MKNRELLSTQQGIIRVSAALNIENDVLMEELIEIDEKITKKLEAVNKIRRSDINFMTYLDRIEEIKKSHARKDKKGEPIISGSQGYDVPAEKHNLISHEIEKLNEEFKATLDIQEKFLDKDSGLKVKINRKDIPSNINGVLLMGIKTLWI